MKRALAVLAASAAALWCARPAGAQIPVTCTSCPTEVSEVIRQGQRLAEYAKMVKQGSDLIGQGAAMYRAVTNIHDLGSAFGALSAVGVQNPLPINPYSMQNLLNGSGGAQGMIGSLSSLYTGTTAGNQVYVPTLRSWVGQQITKQAQAIAGTQAASLQLYQSAGERAPTINAIRARLATANTPAEREMLTAQLQAAQADAQNQLVQSINVQTYSQQQTALREQQREEYLHQRIDAALDEGRALGWFE